MATSTIANPSLENLSAGSAFWKRIWLTAGIQYAGFFVITSLIYGHQPGIGATSANLTAFFEGQSFRILLATSLFTLNFLNLMWFAAALRTSLEELGQGGWGAAATASSATLAATSILGTALSAVLAYSVAATGNGPMMSALNDFSWSLSVLSSFPTAMLIMAGSFGIWRAGLVSNSVFAVAVIGVVLEVLAGTTWASSGLWSPDGAVSRFVSPGILLIWLVGVSQVLLARGSAERAAW